jgi:ABC-2 type transport system permease protein
MSRPAPAGQAIPGQRSPGRPVEKRGRPGAALTGWGVSLRSALHAEWTKLRTLPGTIWTLAGIAVATVGVSAAAVAATRCPGGHCYVDTPKLSLTGVQLAQVVVVILAVTVFGNEYSTGMIRITLAATPRRSAVLAAKSVIVGVLVLAAGTVGVLGSVLAGRLMLPSSGFTVARGFPLLSLGDGPTLRAAAGSVLFLALIALLSTGVAALLRDSAVATGVMLALLFLPSIVVAIMGNSEHWQHRLDRWSPEIAGLAIQNTINLRGLAISPWGGLGVLGLWAAGALLAGGLVLRRRDA